MTTPPLPPIDLAAPRIAIVMMSAIGDAVHVLPVVNAIKRRAPHSHITWVLQPGPASLIRGHPAVDEIIIFDKKRGWRAFEDVRRALTDRHFDLVLALQVYVKAGVVTAMLTSPVKLGFDRARARDMNWLFTTHQIPAHEPQHVQDQYVEFLDALGIDVRPFVWNLGPWPEERVWQRHFYAGVTGPAAVLVIGTTHPQKEWIGSRWAELSDALVERYDLVPILAGGNSAREKETAEVIERHARHPSMSTLGMPLRQLVGVLDGAALVISLDTAPLHMSVALDRPTISLMGYNNPKRVGPYRKFHDLLVDAYGDPGEDYPISFAHRLDRMSRITVEEVLERVERWHTRYREADLLARR
ncbi:MAG: glycosyltransferase family 9 protein [Gemmatimonadota bacterium]|nr:glycosyltransferase family 9 protein [Gemmatimonadota bacterium]